MILTLIFSLCDLQNVYRPTPIVTDMDSDGLAGKHILKLHVGNKKAREREREMRERKKGVGVVVGENKVILHVKCCSCYRILVPSPIPRLRSLGKRLYASTYVVACTCRCRMLKTRQTQLATHALDLAGQTEYNT